MDLRLSVVVFRYYDRKRKTEHDPVDAQSTLEGQTRVLTGGYVSPSIGGDLLRNPKAVGCKHPPYITPSTTAT